MWLLVHAGYQACGYLYMLGLKLNHVIKRDSQVLQVLMDKHGEKPLLVCYWNMIHTKINP